MVIGMLLMFILIFAVAIPLFLTMQDTNSSTVVATNIEEEKRQERIYLINMTTQNISEVEYINQLTIKNTGSILVTLKAVYIDHNFLFDPSDTTINPNGNQINPNSTLSISLETLNEQYKPESIITIATERGTASMVYEKTLISGGQTIPAIQSNFGPLKLSFHDFYYANYYDGSIGEWKPGWLMNTKEGEIVWNITVTNIGDKDILLNSTSCFVLMSIDTPSNTKSWYINITSPLLIETTKNASIVYQWTTPQGVSVNTPFGAECRCKVFLAFFGTFQPTGIPYAQTIPFQAVDIFK